MYGVLPGETCICEHFTSKLDAELEAELEPEWMGSPSKGLVKPDVRDQCTPMSEGFISTGDRLGSWSVMLAQRERAPCNECSDPCE